MLLSWPNSPVQDMGATPSTDLQEAAAPSEGQLLLQLHEALQAPQAPPQQVGGVVEAPWRLQWGPNTRRVWRIAGLPRLGLLLHDRTTPCQRRRLQQLSRVQPARELPCTQRGLRQLAHRRPARHKDTEAQARLGWRSRETDSKSRRSAGSVQQLLSSECPSFHSAIIQGVSLAYCAGFALPSTQLAACLERRQLPGRERSAGWLCSVQHEVSASLLAAAQSIDLCSSMQKATLPPPGHHAVIGLHIIFCLCLSAILQTLRICQPDPGCFHSPTALSAQVASLVKQLCSPTW